jgi:hypothetical protein
MARQNPRMANASAHHIRVKYLLAQMALQDPAGFRARLGPGGDPRYLELLWRALGQELAEEDRVAADGIATWHRPGAADEAEVLLLTLPRPTTRNEAWFLALRIAPDRSCRLFCLESAGYPTTQQAYTVLAEFVPTGRLNWGPACAPERAAFVAWIDTLAQDPQARPVSFVEMPLVAPARA